MPSAAPHEGAEDVLRRLLAAMNAHDLAAFVACFDPDYVSEQPVHPDRHFRGRDQVERNWSAMFDGVPDFHAELQASVCQGNVVWAEWRWTGRRSDGSPLDARGVTIFGDRGGRLSWGRLYMEEVAPGAGIDAAVKSLSAGGGR